MKKITLTSKFIENTSLSDPEKWGLIELLNLVEDGKVHSSYLSYFFPQSIPEFFTNDLLFTVDKEIVTVNTAFLKTQYGIALIESKQEEIEIDVKKVSKVLKAYNEVRSLFHMKQGRPEVPLLQPSKNIYKNLMLIHSFFELNGIEDFYLYFYCLFDSTNWTICWYLKQATHPKCLDIYVNNKVRCNGIIKDEESRARKEKEGNANSIWVATFDFTERKKEMYVNSGQAAVCFNNINETLGYHPKSPVCLSCPCNVACAAKIQEVFQNVSQSKLDILQIRGNIMSVTEAQRVIKDAGSTFRF